MPGVVDGERSNAFHFASPRICRVINSVIGGALGFRKSRIVPKGAFRTVRECKQEKCTDLRKRCIVLSSVLRSELPLKAEVAGSNPVEATSKSKTPHRGVLDLPIP